MTTDDLRETGTRQLRIGRWHGQGDVALVAPTPEGPMASASIISWSCRQLAERGVARVLTSALTAQEQRPFVDSGFVVHERLHLLIHDLHDVPDVAPGIRLRRSRRHDRARVLAVDRSAFEQFWHLDAAGLDDAISATPVSRFRVAVDEEIVGYAVCGRSGLRGYVQRIAVDPAHQRRGIGRALVLDGLHWMRRHRLDQALVNTQEGNDPALALYESLGFRRQREGLAVLTRSL